MLPPPPPEGVWTLQLATVYTIPYLSSPGIFSLFKSSSSLPQAPGVATHGLKELLLLVSQGETTKLGLTVCHRGDTEERSSGTDGLEKQDENQGNHRDGRWSWVAHGDKFHPRHR